MLGLCAVARAISKYANAPQTLETARIAPQYFTRSRKMTFPQLLLFLLNTVNTSTNTALNHFFKTLLGEATHMSQQALSKARGHFDSSPFQGMFREINRLRFSLGNKKYKWNGYQVLAIDGSDITLPNLPAVCQYYGGSGPRADSPMAKASILLDVCNDFIIDACLKPFGTSEREMAIGHIDELLRLCPHGKKLLIFDRGYPSLALIQTISKNKLSFLMRVRSKWNLDVDKASESDSIVTLSDGSNVRVIKLLLPSGVTETLITNLWKCKKDDFMSLYFLRWPVEIKYDVVKNKLALENFSGVSINAIEQDFWVGMLLANIVAVAKQEANLLVQKRQESKNLHYSYLPNTADLVASLKDDFVAACLDPSPQKRNNRIYAVIEEISRSVIPIRPGRSLPRPVARKAKFHFNAKSRT